MNPPCLVHTERVTRPDGKGECPPCRRARDRERKPWRSVHALYLQLLTQRGITPTTEDTK